MKLLDKYILFKFLKTYVFVVGILVAVVCVIDYTEKSDDFLEQNLTLKQIVLEYYINYIPFTANTLSPICVFIAAVFVTSRMASHTEIVAMLTGGMSFRRFLIPYLGGAILLGTMTFFLVGWVVPNAAKAKVAFERKYIKSPFFFDERNIHFQESDSSYVYLESYNNRTKSGYKFTLEEIEGRTMFQKLYSDRIVWVDSLEKWQLKDYELHTFDGQKENLTKGAQLDTTLNLHPEDFESKYKMNETLTFDELNEYIATLRARGIGQVETYLNEKYERYAYPFAVIILTMMGVIVSARKSRQGTGAQIAVGFFLAFIYILFVIMSRSIAQSGAISPMLAAWVPNIVFSVIASIMYFTVPR